MPAVFVVGAAPATTADPRNAAAACIAAVTSATAGAEIRWTNAGSEPTSGSKLYRPPVPGRYTGSLRARAFLRGASSPMGQADYTIGGAVNQPPIVNAGPDQTVEVGTMVVLNGAATRDLDGSELLLSENWTQVEGPKVELANIDETAAFFFPTHTGRYRFCLGVTDGIDSRSDLTVVTVLPCLNDVRNNLVARWSFEEQSGDIALDSASGLWNGAIEGPTWSGSGVGIQVPGTANGPLRFDGGDDVSQVGYLDIAGSALTITAWVRPDDVAVADGRILSKSSGVAESEHLWMLSTIAQGTSHKLRMRIKAGGSTATLHSTGPPPRVNEWTFVAAVYDGQEMRLYQNGTLAGTAPKSGPLTTAPTIPAAIGNQPGGDRAFDGLMDEVRIYAAALSPKELQTVAGETQRLDCVGNKTPR